MALGRGRNASARRASAWIALGVFAFGASLALVLSAYNGSLSPGDVGLVFAFGAFAVVGALIVDRAADNRIGWVCLGVGVGGAMVGFTQAFATYGASHPGTPGILLAAWLQNWLWFPFIGLAFTFLPLLFPDGRLPSRRWRPVAWLSVFDIALLVVAFGFTPSGAWGLIPNPI
jgi:hypothetical protein